MSDTASYALKPLDPARFLIAWDNAQSVARANEIVSFAITKPSIARRILNNGTADTAVNCQLSRCYLGIQLEFDDEVDSLTCYQRFIKIVELRDKGGLGRFYDLLRGLWNPAILMLAEAPCDSMTGYDLADIKARLATIEQPPASIFQS